MQEISCFKLRVDRCALQMKYEIHCRRPYICEHVDRGRPEREWLPYGAGLGGGDRCQEKSLELTYWLTKRIVL